MNDSEGLEGWPLDCIINGMPYPPMVCQALGSPSGIRGPLLIDPLPLTRQQAWLLADGLSQKVSLTKGAYSDCDALADFADMVAERSQNNTQFMADFGAFIPGGDVSSFMGLKYWSSTSATLNTAGASGFDDAYQDSLDPNADQAHHFVALFEYGYLYGSSAAAIINREWETFESATRGTAYNSGDIRLGDIAGRIGSALRAGPKEGGITKDQVGSIIRSEICKKKELQSFALGSQS